MYAIRSYYESSFYFIFFNNITLIFKLFYHLTPAPELNLLSLLPDLIRRRPGRVELTVSKATRALYLGLGA